MASYKPTSGMKDEARKGLEWRSEYGRGGTEVGIARARDIVNDKNLSEETVKRMYSFFSRHEVDKDAEGFRPGEEGYPSNGRIAWALWGGDAGFSWSRSIVDGLDERQIEEKRPYPNEHAARLVDPAKFDDFRRDADAGGNGIDFIYGLLADDGSELQAIRFDADIYSEDEARAWLADHDFKAIEFEPATIEREGTSEHMVNSAIDGATMEQETPMEARHIVSIEETESEYIVTYAKGDVEELVRFSREDLNHRAMHMDAKKIDEEKRTIFVGVSSEEPVERSFGLEVIDHTDESMNLEFLRSGRAPLLLDHDMTKQIGVVEGIELDGETRRLRAKVRFGRNALASEVFNDVVDGIRSNISVGYQIDGRVTRDGDPEDYFRVATTPMEISIVSIPADRSNLVGVERSVPAKPQTMESVMTDKVEQPSVDLEAAKAEAVRAARKNDAEILALAARHNHRDLGEEAIRSGLTIEQFRGTLLEKIENQPLDIKPAAVEVSKKEERTYSIARAIQAEIRGDWSGAGFEREMNQEIEHRTGRPSRGFYVPDFAWSKRSGVMTTAATGAISGENVSDNFVPTIQRGDLFIEALRARQVMSGLGVSYLGGLTNRVRIPKIATGASAGFVEEAGSVSDQSPTDAGVTLTPRTLGAYAQISRLLSLESVPAIENIVQDDLLRSLADKIEYYAINGSGSSGQPTGILNDGNVGNVDISAATDVDALTWADIVALEKTVETANGVVNSATLGWLSSPAVKAKLASTARVSSTDSVMILNDPWDNLYGRPVFFTSNVPTNLDPGDGGNDASALIYGDWSQLLVGLFGAPSIIVDPYTNSKSGDVIISVMQEVDVALRNAVSFAITDEVSVA